MSLSGFQTYGIERVSPTMISNWDAAPATLVLRRVFGVKGQANANMWRGDAVEAGLEALARGRDLSLAQSIADEAFLVRAEGVLDEEADAARLLIPGMVEQCAEFLKEQQYGEILGSQISVEKSFQAIGVPIFGKMDFAFLNGRNIELKTTTRIPAKIENASTSHKWQAAFYADARQQPVDLLYVSAKKFAVFTVEPDSQFLTGLFNTARAMERMLGSHDEGLDLLKSLPTTVDSFYWDDDLVTAYQSALDEKLPPLKGTGTEALLEKGIITFGKHAGRHISDVPDKYLDWLLNPTLSSGETFDVPEQLQNAIRQHREAA